MKKASFALIISASLLLIPALALAAGSGDATTNTGGFSSAPCSGSNCVTTGNTSATVINPLGVKSFCGLVKALLQAAIAIGIPIAVLFIVYAGLKFVLARGNPDALKEARQNFLWTIVGIGIFLGAWLLASVIANTVNALQAGSGNASIISCQ